MSRHYDLRSRRQLSLALGEMKEALRILDELGAPGEIGSHLDLAIARLEKQLGDEPHGAAPEDAFIAASLAIDAHASDLEVGDKPNPWGIDPV